MATKKSRKSASIEREPRNLKGLQLGGLTPKGTRPRAGIPWEEWKTRAYAAAAAAAKRKKPEQTHKSKPVTTIADKWPCPPEKQCDFVNFKTGHRCKSYRMRGATRCITHGGARQNPEHPASIRLVNNGVVDRIAARREARDLIRYHPMRATVTEALEAAGMTAAPETVWQGIQALSLDDGGKGWRRFLARIAGAGKSHAGQGNGGKMKPATGEDMQRD